MFKDLHTFRNFMILCHSQFNVTSSILFRFFFFFLLYEYLLNQEFVGWRLEARTIIIKERMELMGVYIVHDFEI